MRERESNLCNSTTVAYSQASASKGAHFCRLFAVYFHCCNTVQWWKVDRHTQTDTDYCTAPVCTVLYCTATVSPSTFPPQLSPSTHEPPNLNLDNSAVDWLTDWITENACCRCCCWKKWLDCSGECYTCEPAQLSTAAVAAACSVITGERKNSSSSSKSERRSHAFI